jgi:hypothetical protein
MTNQKAGAALPIVDRVARAIGEDERSRCGGTPYTGDDPRFDPWLTDGHLSAARAALEASHHAELVERRRNAMKLLNQSGIGTPTDDALLAKLEGDV